jgi:hypothetical protein
MNRNHATTVQFIHVLAMHPEWSLKECSRHTGLSLPHVSKLRRIGAIDPTVLSVYTMSQSPLTIPIMVAISRLPRAKQGIAYARAKLDSIYAKRLKGQRKTEFYADTNKSIRVWHDGRQLEMTLKEGERLRARLSASLSAYRRRK